MAFIRETIMPLYEYKCTRCGSVIETLQKASDPPLKNCSRCGGPLQKQISSPAIQFKGSGWYITDYARKPANASQSTSPPSSEGEKTDKPAKKTKPEKSRASSPAT
jgi:putative FmdB family regulatory protein